jgi:hypothetical protein
MARGDFFVPAIFVVANLVNAALVH